MDDSDPVCQPIRMKREPAMELYEKLVATNADVERKGATIPYTSRNGHMFSFLTKEGKVGLRLWDQDRPVFLKKYKTKLCEQHGTVMKEYVVVPDHLLKKTRELKRAFDVSYAHVGTLKPKPTTRKKKAVSKKQPAARKKAQKKN